MKQQMTTDNLCLDFVANDNLAGFRLERLEVLNWGTFNSRVWRFDLSGRSALLTGNIGSGKSTLVDAITALLVPPERLAFNKAAGSDHRERSLRSYVLGYYKNERSEFTGASKPVAMRDGSTPSIILGVFYNQGFDQFVSLARIFWMKDMHGQPERLYVATERSLSIAEDFSNLGDDPNIIRKNLRDKGYELFDSFPPYGAWFRRRFGIEHEQALELFNQTVSMKSVGNLTDFVRNQMLESFDSSERIDALIRHFDDLDRAYQIVLKAKRQVELLTPLVEAGETHERIERAIQKLQESRNHVRPYFARIKSGLLNNKITDLKQSLVQLDAEIRELEDQMENARSEIARLEQAIRDNGGSRLEELRSEISRLEKENLLRKNRFNRYRDLLQSINDVAPTDENGFLAKKKSISERVDDLRKYLDELSARERDEDFAFRKSHEELAVLGLEINSLLQRTGNIDSSRIRIRDEMCAELGIDKNDIPFAGELIQVREDARDWEGAIERLLRDFGLSLLVPEAHYDLVSDWINRNHLGAKISYFRVCQRQLRQNMAPHPQSLVHKIAIKQDSKYFDWLEQELRNRFDVVCCDDMEQFRRETYAITRAGQIKWLSGEHEKDDRNRIDDRRHYVLGWSNKEKLLAMKEREKFLKDDLNQRNQNLHEIKKERKRLLDQLGVFSKLEEFVSFSDIDWWSLERKIEDLAAEREKLESASSIIQELGRQLKNAKARQIDLSRQRDATRDRRVKTATNLESAQTQQERLMRIWEESNLSNDQWSRLEDLRAQLLKDRPLDLDSCDDLERDLRDGLQDRIDAENKQLARLAESIINAMRGFKEEFKSDTADMDVSLEALPEYARMLAKLKEDGLPRFESRFKELLNINTINEIASFNAHLARDREKIKEHIEMINRSLAAIDYNQGRYIQIVAQTNPDMEIRQFQQDLRACTEGMLTDSQQYSEEKFMQVKAIIDRLRGREGQLDIDRRWVAKVTDVRNWFLFSVSECWRSDGTEYEHYSDSSGKSGGQKEKLAYTMLAAGLAYQFGLELDVVKSRSFRFVVIDEAFGRGSDESAKYALRLFQRLNLQLLVVTPMQKIHVIEPFVSRIGYVYNDGYESKLKNITIEEYRANDRKITATAII